jgi:hypothetical protein
MVQLPFFLKELPEPIPPLAPKKPSEFLLGFGLK